MSSNDSNQPLSVSPAASLEDAAVSLSGKTRNKRTATKGKSLPSSKRAKTSATVDETMPGAQDTSDFTTQLQHAERSPAPATVEGEGSPLSECTLPDDTGSDAKAPNEQVGPTKDSDEEQSPPPPLANAHPDFGNINYVPYYVLERLINFTQKVDEENNRFAVSRIPSSATWGNSSTTDRMYCIDNRPITYWLVGAIGSKWFTNFKGEPQARVNIGLRLPYRDDAACAKKIYKLASPEKKPEDIPELVYASKYMARQVRGSPDAIAMPFKDVYDAQQRFRSKRQMSIIPPAYLSKHDLVLVEAFLTRWSTAKDKKNNKGEWSTWDVGFELQAVSLLFEAPPAADEYEYSPADNIRDDM